jgi:hypothetical protein
VNSVGAGRHCRKEGRPLFRPKSSIELSNRFDVLRELEKEDEGPAAPSLGSTSARVGASKTSGRGTSKRTRSKVPREVQEVQRATPRRMGTFLRDKEDWRFNRREFRALQEEFGTFTLDACADVGGTECSLPTFLLEGTLVPSAGREGGAGMV